MSNVKKRTVFEAFVVVIAMGLIGIITAASLAMHRFESPGTTPADSRGSIDKPTFSPSLSGPPTPMCEQRGAYSPGSGSYCGTLSLTYICRQLAIEAPPIKIAGLINDRGTGVSMLDLARGAKSLGLKAKGIRTDLVGLKALPKPLIAFLPEAKHFLVVSKADDQGITCIDLAGQNALTWYSPQDFASKWNGEILIFDNSTPELCSALGKAEMSQYVGGCGNESCTKVIQNAGVFSECENLSDCSVTSYYTLFKRYGCETCSQRSTCNESSMSRGYLYPCVGGLDPLECEPDFSASPTLWGSISACN